MRHKTPAEEYSAESVAVVKEGMLQSETSRFPKYNPIRIAGPRFNFE